MSKATKGKVFMVDMSPTWIGVLPVLIEMVKNGSPELARDARLELERMARLADETVAASKAKAA